MDCAKPETSKKSQHSVPTFILDDLCSRFIINMPEEERSNLVRICFQVELAHWFYLDFFCTDESYHLQPCGIRQFAAHIFQHVPFLQQHRGDLDSVLNTWREYKLSVPTYGAILLDSDLTHVLLVQSYWTKASWGFPKGKVSANEEPWHCAVREVLEETGFDISKLINKNDYIESTIHEQTVRLYVIGHVPRDTRFQPRTRNEIKACEWFPLADLPSNKKDATPKLKMGVSANSFFMVLPFVNRMRRWVAERNPKRQRPQRLRCKKQALSLDELFTPAPDASPPPERDSSPAERNPTPDQSQKPARCRQRRTKRQLFTPARDASPGAGDVPEFVAPAWANFRLDRQAVLDCLT